MTFALQRRAFGSRRTARISYANAAATTSSLDGEEPVPTSPPPTFVTPADVPGFEIDEALAAEGKAFYSSNCAFCHGAGSVSGGYAPDLRASPFVLDEAAFKEVVTQ
jgi:quinohemoprotein ethanol dehydrogenase